jgi:hypothetical protein
MGGIPRRGIYDSMKIAVERVGAGKKVSVSTCFVAMNGCYLLEAECLSRAAGWEKSIVERDVHNGSHNLGRSYERVH